MTDTRYQRNRRRFDPEYRERQKAVVLARGRALTRLAEMYPADYERLWVDEMGRERQRSGRPVGAKTRTSRGIPLDQEETR